MTTLPIEIVREIIRYLPLGSQVLICKTSKREALPKLANRIKHSMKANRARIMAQMDSEKESLSVLRSAHCLYKYLTKQEMEWTMYYAARTSAIAKQIINDGVARGWHIKRVHRFMIYQLDYDELYKIGW